MKPDEIKQALDEKGYSLSILAAALGLNLSHVSSVLYQHTTSYKVASAIAKIIELPVEQVFPGVPAYTKNKDTRSKKIQALRELLASE
ncbi:helix-turn-helix domain-containing protein [Pseudoalteromonas sp. bablab_jr011]|uniref:helix-turn-helix domain-containing protein n=1 Tax=Pseudoalteromonas sp. bablab_jr011 TaxID=2755062 RepID=UPI0018F6FA96|nr:helix-turn-helix domain-containing protein [Pseudoalteromonas sp. bablab_jr011]